MPCGACLLGAETTIGLVPCRAQEEGTLPTFTASHPGCHGTDNPPCIAAPKPQHEELRSQRNISVSWDEAVFHILNGTCPLLTRKPPFVSMPDDRLVCGFSTFPTYWSGIPPSLVIFSARGLCCGTVATSSCHSVGMVGRRFNHEHDWLYFLFPLPCLLFFKFWKRDCFETTQQNVFPPSHGCCFSS